MIKFDLHIHSYASRYKESAGIVDSSTTENAEVLMRKLEESGVGLFSITDHNRFDPELYNRLDELLVSGQFPTVQGLVAGVEFDVQLDPDMDRCHIITIFDAENRADNYQRIYEVIQSRKLIEKNAAYSKREFEDLLREIQLDVILIACQRNSLEKHDGHHNSLSEATMNPEELLMTGYINALEFQRPNVEGILRDNLKQMPQNVMLVMGSDCHEWVAYPNHDSHQGNPQFRHSTANILPTFKGLLMAVTSPETRINQPENRNHNFITSITINGVDIPLVNGINAIIGENGSGKSTLLKIMHGEIGERFVSSLKEKNRISCDNGDVDKRLFIKQGQIVKAFDEKSLFPSDYFQPVDHARFRAIYSEFAKGILCFIRKKIKAREALDALSKDSISYNELMHVGSYFISIKRDNDFGEIENEHEAADRKVITLLDVINSMKEDEYYEEYFPLIEKVVQLLMDMYTSIHYKNKMIQLEKTVKNYIISAIRSYEIEVNNAATSQEREQRDFQNLRRDFIGHIINAIKENISENQFPALPRIVPGYSSNPKNGFNFNSEANYHNRDVVNDFLARMFTKGYSTIESLQAIDTIEELVDAVYRCTDSNTIDTIFQKNLDSFIEDMCQCKNYIVDTMQDDEELGNTLGELSLAYFKYVTENETDRCIFLIDQPEDHISNNNISQKLLNYLNAIRTKKQIIMVTHNPLLVVNQDVDQVLFVHKNGDRIDVVSGCLEYEENDISILDIVAKNMDGGKDSIEKRLKVYGKENNPDYATF